MPRGKSGNLTREEGDFCEHCQKPGGAIGVLAFGVRTAFCHDHGKCWLCLAHIEIENARSRAATAKGRPPS